MGNQYYIAHGIPWQVHKYIAKIGDRYIYTMDQLKAAKNNAGRAAKSAMNQAKELANDAGGAFKLMANDANKVLGPKMRKLKATKNSAMSQARVAANDIRNKVQAFGKSAGDWIVRTANEPKRRAQDKAVSNQRSAYNDPDRMAKAKRNSQASRTTQREKIKNERFAERAEKKQNRLENKLNRFRSERDSEKRKNERLKKHIENSKQRREEDRLDPIRSKRREKLQAERKGRLEAKRERLHELNQLNITKSTLARRKAQDKAVADQRRLANDPVRKDLANRRSNLSRQQVMLNQEIRDRKMRSIGKQNTVNQNSISNERDWNNNFEERLKRDRRKKR